jgi:hypothetical protein
LNDLGNCVQGEVELSCYFFYQVFLNHFPSDCSSSISFFTMAYHFPYGLAASLFLKLTELSHSHFHVGWFANTRRILRGWTIIIMDFEYHYRIRCYLVGTCFSLGLLTRAWFRHLIGDVQWASIHFWISSDKVAVSLAFRHSSCLKRNGRSDVEPVVEVIATFTSSAMMVVRPSCLAFASAPLTTASDKALSWSRKKDTASTPTRKVEWALMNDSTVLRFVISDLGIVGQYTEFRLIMPF